MSQSMLLPLRFPLEESNWAPLETRVRQIESLKGSFRTVTEASLQGEIDRSKIGVADDASSSEESDEEDDSPETKQKRLWEAREEMMKQLLRAQNETLTALDTISLLLSRYPKTQAAAKASMSPALSSAVPISTLDAEKVRRPEFLASSEQRNQSLYLGYRLGGLNSAIDKMNNARTRLSDQAKHESAFWKQVADLSAEGLVVSRLPRDSRRIGVHFGFPEAAPRFRNRGFAVLRTDQGGELMLDQTITASKRYSVQVSTYRNGNLVSRSKPSTVVTSKMTLAATVADLRRSLFEEELFFEIGLEARAIANQGVAIVNRAITADIDNGQRMRIELVENEQQSMATNSAEDGSADGIVLCLRSLLSKGHEQSLARRSQPPAPLMPKAPPIPEYALLRPLLSHMRHQSLLSTLRAYCDSFKITMRTARMGFDVKFTSVLTTEGLRDDQLHHELFLNSLLAPADSTLEITLPSGRLFEINVRTHLAPPAFGTVFTGSPVRYDSFTLVPPKMSNLDAVKTAFCSVLTADVVEVVRCSLDAAGQQQWKSTGRYSGELRSHDATLHIKAITKDTSLVVRCLKRSESASSAGGHGWAWQGEKMLRFSAGIQEVLEPRKLTEIATDLSTQSIN